MVNATFATFGWPETEIAELEHWGLMLRPAQPTLGSLVLVCKQPVTSFAEVSPDGFAELHRAISGIETMLQSAVGFAKINYLMLMMVDPDVHFHVIPRYEDAKDFDGQRYADHGWPGPPALGQSVTPHPKARAALLTRLRAHWPRSV
ncbi:MAG: HIT family protein [Pseudomonadota bacterium]